MGDAHPVRPGTGWHCVGKEPFETGQAARKAAKHIMKLGKGSVEVYRCPTCSKFHMARKLKHRNQRPVKRVQRLF